MNFYSETAKRIPEFISLANAIRKTRLPAGVTGLSHIHKAHVIASMCQCLMKKALVIAPDEAQATRLRQDYGSIYSCKKLGQMLAVISLRVLQLMNLILMNH